jgi:hypothetical protein
MDEAFVRVWFTLVPFKHNFCKSVGTDNGKPAYAIKEGSIQTVCRRFLRGTNLLPKIICNKSFFTDCINGGNEMPTNVNCFVMWVLYNSAFFFITSMDRRSSVVA